MKSRAKGGTSNKKRVLVKKSIVVRNSLENPDHYLILNTSTGESYEVNITGKKILDCCNGSLTKDEIAKKIVEMDRYKINRGDERILIKDIIQYLETLLKEGILDETENY